MRNHARLLPIAVLLLASASVPAREDVRNLPVPTSRPALVRGGPAGPAAKAAVDTTLLIGPWGSGAPFNGEFETPSGAPAWNGWTGVDITEVTVNHWHVDDFAFDGSGAYVPLAGARSAWCGSAAYAVCEAGDPVGGYGNSWNDVLEFRGTVDDAGAACNLAVDALAATDCESGFDFLTLELEKQAGHVTLGSWDGKLAAFAVSEAASYLPGEYVGAGADEVVVLFRFESDGGWSDEDCMWRGAGAAFVDDFAVTSDNGVGTGGAIDFEDGTLGPLVLPVEPGVGDFAKVWNNLDDADPCASNATPQVAFIDDGLVVPGTGGTPCITWCYGPQGYVVNSTGGLLGPQDHLHNGVVSPPVAWPGPDHEGARLAFTAYGHSPFDQFGGANGVFYTWDVRSTSDPDPASLELAAWDSDGFLFEGGPQYRLHDHDVGALIAADAEWVQVRLAAYELGWVWGIDGDDGTPAPYFDNVRLQAFPQEGPDLTARTIDLAQDAFPESGTLDPGDLGSHHVRFDAARNSVFTNFGETRIDPGDTLVVHAVPLRAGATLAGTPVLHYSLRRNPVYNPFRSAGLPDQGAVAAWQAVDPNGYAQPDYYAVDLPDTGFLYPGDVLHYYVTATDDVGGDQRTAILPADTTGFGDFSRPDAYDPLMTVRALPGVRDAGLSHPSLLVWDDAGDADERAALLGALANLGLVAGADYDLYTTVAPSSGQGNGLGGRATAAQLAGYADLVYTSGNESVHTLGAAEPYEGGGPDVELLTAWLEQGGKDLLVCGDHLAMDLVLFNAATNTFRVDWLGVDALDDDATPLLGGRSHPVVEVAAGNPVLAQVAGWRAVATCRLAPPYPTSGFALNTYRTYDAVIPLAGATALAEYLDPAGLAGAYTFKPAVLHERTDVNARVVTLAHALAAVWTDPDEGTAKDAARLAARARLLGDVLDFFGGPAGGAPSAAGPPAALAAACGPNPFNPATVISWDLPRDGRVSVRVFDLRGRRLRTLVDAPQRAGAGHVTWDGRDGAGARVASGVYFYEVRAGDESVLGKMTLVK